MANASQQVAGVSFRGVQILALDANGLPAAVDKNEYAGLRIVGAKALTLNRPEWENLYATGDDRVLASFTLPPTEGVSGELRLGAFDMTAEALLNGVTIKDDGGERMFLPFGVDVMPLPQVCLLGWREAKSVAAGDAGRPHYECVLIPRATLTPRGGSYDERAVGERTLGILAHSTAKYPWGEALSAETDGHTVMEGAEFTAEYVPRICAFVGDGATLTFPFSVDMVDTDKVKVYQVTASVWSDITEATTLTIAVDDLTFSAGNAPADGAVLIVVGEVAA